MKLTARHIPVFCLISVMLVGEGICRAEVSQKDLDQVEKQVQQQTLAQKQYEKEAEKAGKELLQVNQEMIKAARAIQNNEEAISEMEDQLLVLEKDYKEAQANLLKHDQNLVKTVSALQSLALKPTEALFVQPLSPVDIIRSAMLLRETVPYLETEAEIIRQELDVLSNKRHIIKRQVDRIIQQKSKLEREQAQMKVLAETKTKYRAQVSQKSLEARRNVAKLAGQAQDLRDLLTKLEKERAEKRRKMAEEAKQKILSSSKSEQAKSADLIKLNPDIINETGAGFIKAKGKLAMPARGRIVTRYGEEMSKGVSSKGITIKTRDMAQVTAPFDGSVLFAGPFRGYGNLIIIEHGKGYTSLLAGLDSVDCETGQMLLAGEPIGVMPTGEAARLYMELRKDNHPINPESWIKRN